MSSSSSRVFVAVAVALVIVAVAACGRTTTVEASFTVEGMTCESCSSAITDALAKIDGVEQATADHLAGTASAVFRSPAASAEQLANEIEGLGYTVTATTTVPVGD
jgi:copper chaperone CopZ